MLTVKTLYKEIHAIGIVPVVVIEDAQKAVPVAMALKKGGLPCAEVTFRTAAAEDAIRNITHHVPDMLVGAGTVLTVDQVERAVAAGAKFIVSPGLNPTVVAYCVERNIPVIPGCANPGDVERALSFGLSVVKFFPAEQAGGMAMLKAMSAVYRDLKFMPTGGITENNLNDYLAFDNILACGGSWMVKADWINNEKYDQIRTTTVAAVQKMHSFCLKHVGIHTADKQEATQICGELNNCFGFGIRETHQSFFVGRLFEVMFGKGRGIHGHLAVGCNNLLRAVVCLEAKGIVFDYDSAEYDKKGNMTFIYLKEPIGGFSIHLVPNC
jgi:2-dehydro-3-deoxyphosphogluconate aldolase/(4S)-4-hydroxy-2-oxoglutarate aldolase